jgi:hypothetical protein
MLFLKNILQKHMLNLQVEEFHYLVLVEYQARMYNIFIHWYIHRHMSMIYFRKPHSEVHATTFGSHQLQ